MSLAAARCRPAMAVAVALWGMPSPLAAQAAAAAGALPAIAVWDFDDQTPAAAANARLDYLRRGLSESLLADLVSSASLQVVERQRLNDVLAEQKLGAGELADEDARLRLGRIAGAGRMVFGGFFALGDSVQVNVRVVDTATSRVLFADEITADAASVFDQFQKSQAQLVRALAGAAASADTAAHDQPAAAWQRYDAALALSDAGRYDDACAALQALLQQFKNFTPAQRQLAALLDKMRRR